MPRTNSENLLKSLSESRRKQKVRLSLNEAAPEIPSMLGLTKHNSSGFVNESVSSPTSSLKSLGAQLKRNYRPCVL